ncbi:MAG: basic amino acid ABC transporter substrate-binding protein [Syntrophomonadaceae bacterium]|jgi:polar amino acid transport system substrate-binding protein|nr:basic amino acid ABC transporter substrate-binding protein [Syntrophomonadaceae bacterium]
MSKKVKMILSGLLIMGLIFSVIGCGGQDKADSNDPADGAKGEKTKLVVGAETTFPPMEFMEGGEYVGFDMDLIRAIAEAENMEVEMNSLGFDALIPAVQTGQIDCVISAMSITDERKESVDFTEPYFQAGLIIAVKSDNTTINNLEDLEGKKIAAQIGTTGADACNGVKEKDAATEVSIYNSTGEAYMALENDVVDAVINDHPVTMYYVNTEGQDKVKTVGEVFAAEDTYGIAVKKGNAELLNKLNKGLQKIRDDGTYDEIYDKWFK